MVSGPRRPGDALPGATVAAHGEGGNSLILGNDSVGLMVQVAQLLIQWYMWRERRRVGGAVWQQAAGGWWNIHAADRVSQCAAKLVPKVLLRRVVSQSARWHDERRRDDTAALDWDWQASGLADETRRPAALLGLLERLRPKAKRVHLQRAGVKNDGRRRTDAAAARGRRGHSEGLGLEILWMDSSPSGDAISANRGEIVEWRVHVTGRGCCQHASDYRRDRFSVSGGSASARHLRLHTPNKNSGTGAAPRRLLISLNGVSDDSGGLNVPVPGRAQAQQTDHTVHRSASAFASPRHLELVIEVYMVLCSDRRTTRIFPFWACTRPRTEPEPPALSFRE
ncbi:hypothetical protein GGX14DRAFT_656387 [Mycena pura]|uniref:Uncharacterized protein n=1 Tax=Mycena pura TaxID=153505 RepID=A0AAD6Y9V4_9AGAR|nr:hypothetical protein GGX14DRAFT_656387 [Mycena pura]